jgi:hypothetical protein
MAASAFRDAVASRELTPCTACGLRVVGGTVGCQRLFDDESVREYADVRYARRRRMIVDAYCLQHPDRYCVSAISLAAHLSGLCVAVEHPGREQPLNDAVQRWLSGRPRLEKPPLPDRRGSMRIADVRRTTEPADHEAVTERWAFGVWTEYQDLQPTARTWVDAADGGRARGR